MLLCLRAPPVTVMAVTLRFWRLQISKYRDEAHIIPIRPVPVLNCVSDIPSAAYATVSASPAGLTVLGGLQEGSRGRSGKRPHTASAQRPAVIKSQQMPAQAA